MFSTSTSRLPRLYLYQKSPFAMFHDLSNRLDGGFESDGASEEDRQQPVHDPLHLRPLIHASAVYSLITHFMSGETPTYGRVEEARQCE